MVQQQNPGESQASIGVTSHCEYGHLISNTPYKRNFITSNQLGELRCSIVFCSIVQACSSVTCNDLINSVTVL